MATTKKRKSSGAEASPAGAGPGFADSVVRFYSGLFQEWRRATSFKSPDLDSFFLNKDRVEVGLTPHDVVYEEGKLRLLHYRAQSKKVLRPPLLVVYALVNRPYILDLRPGRSVIEALVKGGVDVYLIDWGAPDLADRYLDLDDYVSGLIPRCAERAMKRAGTDKVSMLGYCMGGTLSTMFAATHPGWVKNLILMAAPIDFHVREGLLNLWSDARNYDVDQLVDAYGNVPPWLLSATFQILKPVHNTMDKYVQYFENAGNKEFVENFMAMERWINDGVAVPGEVFRDFIKGCYQQNLLCANRLTVGGRKVLLKNIKAPVLNLVATKDHLVPPASSLALNSKIGSADVATIEFPVGHVGLSVSSSAIAKLWPRVIEWLKSRSGSPRTRKKISK